MILRRLTQHVKAQNWTAVALDFVIVVVGVFMGLQVQEWNTVRKDKIEAVLTLDRLEDDFTRINERAARSLALHEASLAATARIINGIAAGRLDLNGLAEDLSLSTRGATPPGPSTTFQELKSNGRIGLIENLELRSQLSDYDDYATLVRQEFRVFQEPLATMRERFMAVRVMEATGEPSRSFDELGATVSVDADLILNDRALLQLLQTAYLTHDNAHVVYADMQERIDLVLRSIRTQKEARRRLEWFPSRPRALPAPPLTCAIAPHRA